jgi:hypothetical protein
VLEQLRREARKTGAKITTITATGEGELDGWTIVLRNGEPTGHYFKELGTRCTC